ncbi:hypothetical protein Daus18300_004625 [Diaporthe australafricana]|uniref:F-box domain-containing protein n=1 Tax=Diaporthe australafricana TaxID=127596 RepID=A0ABR3X716_9PEZI
MGNEFAVAGTAHTSPPADAARLRGTQGYRQSKITETFAAQGPPRPILQVSLAPTRIPRVTFLDLPKQIRDKVYEYANVGGGKFIDLNFWTIKSRRMQDHNGERLVREPGVVADYERAGGGGNPSPYSEEPFPSALLWAGSRIVHDEVVAKLYSQNAFAVSLSGLDGLRPLEMLGDAALRELRFLLVSLCACRCLPSRPFCAKSNWGYGECNIWPRRRGDYFRISQRHLVEDKAHSRPLRLQSLDKLTLARWQRICARLARCLRPGQLRLYLLAEVAEMPIASTLLEPLQTLPTLKEAAISLSNDLAQPALRSLARQSALSLMNRLQQPSFPFLRLPLELQMHVLWHTDLKAKGYYLWTPSQRFRASSPGPTCSSSPLATDDDNDISSSLGLGGETFCSQRHSAFHPRCGCLNTPLNYFLVSREFAMVSRSVFYSNNKFVLLPSRYGMNSIAGLDDAMGTNDTNESRDYQLTLPSFLARLPSNLVIPNLKNITLVFPPMTPSWLLADQRGWHEWVQSVETLAQMAHNLSLEVHFADQGTLPHEVPDDPRSFLCQSMWARTRPAPGLEGEMSHAYHRMLDPLKKLGPRLRSLLVFVAWPLGGSRHEERKLIERGLERMVMGESYDSAEWRKPAESGYSQPDHCD